MLVTTLLDYLEDYITVSKKNKECCNLRMSVDGVYKIKGYGTIICGTIEQGILKVRDEVKFLPRDNSF